MNQYKRLERRTGYSGSFLNMFIDTVQLPNEHIIELEFIDHPGAAAIVPVDEDGNIIMVRQFRYAASGYIYEIPAGKLDNGEAPELCAARELQEETGYRSEKTRTPWIHLDNAWIYQ